MIDGQRPLLGLTGPLVEGERVVAAAAAAREGGGVRVEPLQEELEDGLRVVLAVRPLQRHRDVTQRQDRVPGNESPSIKLAIKYVNKKN